MFTSVKHMRKFPLSYFVHEKLDEQLNSLVGSKSTLKRRGTKWTKHERFTIIYYSKDNQNISKNFD